MTGNAHLPQSIIRFSVQRIRNQYIPSASVIKASGSSNNYLLVWAEVKVRLPKLPSTGCIGKKFAAGICGWVKLYDHHSPALKYSKSFSFSPPQFRSCNPSLHKGETMTMANRPSDRVVPEASLPDRRLCLLGMGIVMFSPGPKSGATWFTGLRLISPHLKPGALQRSPVNKMNQANIGETDKNYWKIISQIDNVIAQSPLVLALSRA